MWQQLIFLTNNTQVIVQFSNMEKQVNSVKRHEDNEIEILLRSSSAVYTPFGSLQIQTSQEVVKHARPTQAQTIETKTEINKCVQGFHQSFRTQDKREQQLNKLEQILAKYSPMCRHEIAIYEKNESKVCCEEKQVNGCPNRCPLSATNKPKEVNDVSKQERALTVLVIGLLIVAMIFALLVL